MRSLFLAALLTACTSVEAVSSHEQAQATSLHVTAMAPLVIESEPAWQSFEADIREAKKLGIESISVDVWWGEVEPRDQEFDWRWVDRISQTILDAGLKWRPVLAFHACGGNVGDTCHVPLPNWLFTKYGPDVRYVSAQGNTTDEVLSVWATPLVLQEYKDFFAAFAARYPTSEMSGIAVGLGPASELRYPSYNAHDQNAGYPTGGVIQSYSRLAKESFTAKTGRAVMPSNPASTDHQFFDWYRGSLLEHGRLILDAAGDALPNVRLVARIPGVHWRAGDTRRAELSAGLITLDAPGHGYDPLVQSIANLRTKHPNITLDYTCLEMGNGEGGPAVASLAEDLVFWVADSAHRHNVPIGGENALAGGLHSTRGWDRIENALKWSHYDHLTLLRVSDVVNSSAARAALGRLIQ